jgi:hypothetical protein
MVSSATTGVARSAENRTVDTNIGAKVQNI